MDSYTFLPNKGWLKQGFWTSEPFISNSDNLTIWKFIALLQGGRGNNILHFLVKVQGNIAEFLLDVTDDLTVSNSAKSVTTLYQDLHQNIENNLTLSKYGFFGCLNFFDICFSLTQQFCSISFVFFFRSHKVGNVLYSRTFAV